jgi:hypothetical protein
MRLTSGVTTGAEAMAFKIRRVCYFYATVQDEPGQAHTVLSQFAHLNINLLAFTAVPIGPSQTQLAMFPEDVSQMTEASRQAGITLDGPHSALLVQGDDELGALAGIHERLAAAQVNVYASTGVTDGEGSFGYVLYVRPEEYERATSALAI